MCVIKMIKEGKKFSLFSLSVQKDTNERESYLIFLDEVGNPCIKCGPHEIVALIQIRKILQATELNLEKE